MGQVLDDDLDEGAYAHCFGLCCVCKNVMDCTNDKTGCQNWAPAWLGAKDVRSGDPDFEPGEEGSGLSGSNQP